MVAPFITPVPKPACNPDDDMRPDCIRALMEIQADIKAFKVMIQWQNSEFLKFGNAANGHAKTLQDHGILLAVMKEWRDQQRKEIDALKKRDLIWGTTVLAIVAAIQIAAQLMP